MLAGPYCGMLLADLGAEVVKIESREGDIARRISPHEICGHNAYFASLNRSKKSVVLDLRTREGQRALHGLAARAHALIANLRPAAIERLGLTYDALKGVNPGLVCVALTGYGMHGSHADRPAYDYVVQALSGVMALTGEPDGPPVKTGYSAVDNSAGMMAALGLLAKIVEGRGGQIDVSMHDVMLSQLNYLAGAWLNAAQPVHRMTRSAHPYIVPAQLFETCDGWLVVFISHDEFWRRFCIEAGRRHWIEDPRFATMAARRENRELVLAALGELFAGDSAASWTARLAPLGVVVAPVRTLEQALASELAHERDMVISIPCREGELRAVGNPVRIDGMRCRYAPPPRLGEHTDALCGMAGDDELARRILERDRRAIARGISAIENDTGEGRALCARFDALRGAARVVGITGPPGAGKSTLVSVLVQRLLARARRVAVVAIDPSSPISGGAMLGDRLRMEQVQAHDDVYIRSLATRGRLGGVSGATAGVVALLDAAGFHYVLVETAGTGQSDVEIARVAQTRVLLCPAGAGDDVQAMKAGVLEIADALVVSKSDLAGAEHTADDLRAAVSARRAASGPALFCICAVTGEGVDELVGWLESGPAQEGAASPMGTGSTHTRDSARFGGAATTRGEDGSRGR